MNISASGNHHLDADSEPKSVHQLDYDGVTNSDPFDLVNSNLTATSYSR